MNIRLGQHCTGVAPASTAAEHGDAPRIEQCRLPLAVALGTRKLNMAGSSIPSIAPKHGKARQGKATQGRSPKEIHPPGAAPVGTLAAPEMSPGWPRSQRGSQTGPPKGVRMRHWLLQGTPGRRRCCWRWRSGWAGGRAAGRRCQGRGRPRPGEYLAGGAPPAAPAGREGRGRGLRGCG